MPGYMLPYLKGSIDRHNARYPQTYISTIPERFLIESINSKDRNAQLSLTCYHGVGEVPPYIRSIESLREGFLVALRF